MATYTVEQFTAKYGEWKAPNVQLKIDGTSVTETGLSVLSAEMEAGVGVESGYCAVTLGGVYDLKRSRYTCEDILVPGTPVEVLFGYIVTTRVFHGYLYSTEYHMGEDGYTVHAVCMDAKAAMMGAGALGMSGTTTWKEAIEGMFQGSAARGYGELCPVPDLSGMPELDRPVAFSSARLDDYQLVADMVGRFGLEWILEDGKMILRKQSSAEKTPLLELSGQGLIRSVDALFTTAGYVGSITVHGGNDDEREKDSRFVKSEAKNRISIAPNSSAAGRLIGGRRAELFVGSVRDEKAARELAEAQLRLRAQKAVTIAICMQGIPELKPGRYIRLDRISPKINGSLYITQVTHRFGEEGYTTTIQTMKQEG